MAFPHPSPGQEETGTREAKPTLPFHFFLPMGKVFTQVKTFPEKIPAGGKRGFCRFHRTPLVPVQGKREPGSEPPTARAPGEMGPAAGASPRRPPKGEGGTGRAARRGFAPYKRLRPPLSFAEARARPPSALGAFSTNRGKEEREEEITALLVKIAERPAGSYGGFRF